MAHTLSKLSELADLRLELCHHRFPRSHGTAALADGLKVLRSLRHLVLKLDKVQSVPLAEHLARVVSNLTGLGELTLSLASCGIRDNDLCRVALALQTPHANLKRFYLDVGSNMLQGPGLAKLARCIDLNSAPQLRVFDLSCRENDLSPKQQCRLQDLLPAPPGAVQLWFF